MKLVTQEDDDGCVHACIAMVTGQSYKDVRAVDRHELSMFRVISILSYFGYIGEPQTYPVLPLTSATVALVTVPSLNIPGGNHQVVWVADDLKVFDPNEMRAGRKWYTTQTMKSWSEVIIVKENPYGKRN